ncbi:EamA family transporter [Ectobacillus funiculus]|uniref:EamA family transporter n=1 Tax=Ectobacillus funiculus TaxID=137993 RepID=UPI00397DC373
MAVELCDATTISMSILGEPVGAATLAFLLLCESLTGMQILGDVLVLAGVFLLAGVFFFLMQQQKRLILRNMHKS